jgi:hypothetical protein
LLEPLIDALARIPHKAGRITLEKNLDLISLFNEKRLSRYYRYDGSLTTPPCYESVIWSVLSEPLSISAEQLDKFYSLRDESNKPITNTHRPIQSLGTRRLFRSFVLENVDKDEPNRWQSTRNNHASHISVNILTTTVFIGILMFRG